MGVTRVRVFCYRKSNDISPGEFGFLNMVFGRGPKSANKLSLNKVNAHDGGRHLQLIIRATAAAATTNRAAVVPRRGVRVSGLLNYSDECSVPTKITFLRVYDSHRDYHIPITYVRARNYNVNLRF